MRRPRRVGKPVFVEAFVAEFAIDALRGDVLDRLNKAALDPDPPRPSEHRPVSDRWLIVVNGFSGTPPDL